MSSTEGGAVARDVGRTVVEEFVFLLSKLVESVSFKIPCSAVKLV